MGARHVGEGDGVPGGSGVCLGGDEQERGAAEDMCAGVAVGTGPAWGADGVCVAVL